MDLNYDIVIVGGSFGGVAAALRAGAMGANVCLIEASDWLGGQYTAQGVTRPDENRFTQTTGSTASYRAFQHDVRAYYRNNFNLSAKGASQPAFNPSGGYPGFGMEPRVGHNILQQELLSSPNIHLRLNTTVSQVEMSADPNTVASLTAVTAGVSARYIAPWFLDATDLGDLLPLCGVEGLDWMLGAEGKDETGEPHAPDAPRRDWIQPITFPFALERRPAGENHTIPKPDEYEHFRDVQGYSIKDGCIGALFYHGPSDRGDCTDSQGRKYVDDMWGYRQFIDASNFHDPRYPNDLTMMNTDSNDFKEGGTLPSDSPEQDQEVMRRARLASLGYLYWLQTECPRDENPNKHGYPELKPRGDLFGTDNGLSAQPYIRESRRIKALTTILEQDISAEVNPGPRAKLFPDSCGIGLYGLDIHKLKAVGMPQLFIDALPFQIPMSALIPVRLTNLLAACKNLGVTHLTNGAYRLHPVEWNIGESAGALAAFCVQANKSAKEVAQTPELLKAYQRALLEQGIPLFWWTDIELSDPIFTAAHMLGVAGILSGDEKMHFLPNDLLDPTEKQFIEDAVGRPLNWPAETLTRRQAAPWLVQELGL